MSGERFDPSTVQVPDIIIFTDEAAKALINTKVPRLDKRYTPEEVKIGMERVQRRLDDIRQARQDD